MGRSVLSNSWICHHGINQKFMKKVSSNSWSSANSSIKELIQVAIGISCCPVLSTNSPTIFYLLLHGPKLLFANFILNLVIKAIRTLFHASEELLNEVSTLIQSHQWWFFFFSTSWIEIIWINLRSLRLVIRHGQVEWNTNLST